jgi:hypothetical protein
LYFRTISPDPESGVLTRACAQGMGLVSGFETQEVDEARDLDQSIRRQVV